VHRRRRPGARAPLRRSWRDGPLGVEDLGNPILPNTVSTEAEDPPNNGGLALVDPAFDVRSLAGCAEDAEVVVPERSAAVDVPRLGLSKHRIVRALPRFLALEFVGGRRQRQHDLVGGRIERALASLEVEEHAHAGGNELLERVRRFDRFAARGAILPT
jgi:hypothetical protein